MSDSAKLELYLPHMTVARIMLVVFNAESTAWHFKSINQATVTSQPADEVHLKEPLIFPSKAAHPQGAVLKKWTDPTFWANVKTNQVL